MAQKQPIDDARSALRLVDSASEDGGLEPINRSENEETTAEGSLLPMLVGILAITAVLAMLAWWWNTTGG